VLQQKKGKKKACCNKEGEGNKKRREGLL